MAAVYNSLPDIEEASSTLRDLDDGILRGLSHVLLKYELNTHFGISLVHKHFDLEDENELVVDLRD